MKTEIATLAGGCFWGVEDIFRKTKGVLATQVGYTGGTVPHPTYEQVCTQTTGHAEAVRVEFNSDVLPYEQLLKLFFRLHDPTTLNRQGPDQGNSYRSAIFFHSKSQFKLAGEVIAWVEKQGWWKDPIVTEVVEASAFFAAEEYHQKYFERHPDHASCHFLRTFEPA